MRHLSRPRIKEEDVVIPAHSGLSSAEAAVRLERDGPNLLPQKPPTPLWR
ncbi:cation-transporting P-type ATPase, partial [Nonomuraea jabiensis]